MEINVGKEVAALARMTPAELRERYAEVFGEATVTKNRTWLVRRIAWRLQVLAEGDLSERARQRAIELARDADLRVIPPREKITASCRAVIRGRCDRGDGDRGMFGVRLDLPAERTGSCRSVRGSRNTPARDLPILRSAPRREQGIEQSSAYTRQPHPKHRAEDRTRDRRDRATLPDLVEHEPIHESADRGEREDDQPARDVGEHVEECRALNMPASLPG